MHRRRTSGLIVVTAATLALTAGGPPAFADDALRSVSDTLMTAPTTTHPKRLGYFEPVDDGRLTWPGVSLQQAHDVGHVVADVGEGVRGVADAPTAYTLWEAHTLTLIENERDEVVYEDRMTFRYRQSHRDGSISGVSVVPEESWCRTYGGLSAYAFTAVTETCWYVIGFVGPDVFSFVSGSRFATMLGPVRWGTHWAGGSYVTERDGTYRHDAVSVNGERCPSVGDLPPGWTPYCGLGGRDEVRV